MNFLKLFIWFTLLLPVINVQVVSAQAPANDNCSNAEIIAVPNSGYGTGTFVSSQIDLTNATVQAAENFTPVISLAGLDKKSVWFKFSIASTRAVRITLTQPGIAITGGDAGFAVYKSSNCFPSNADISTKLTAIVAFGNTYHPCVPAGDYIIQVSAKAIANGPINISVEINNPAGAAFDHPAQAYAFGTVTNFARKIDFDASCHSADDANELCSNIANSNDYLNTAWFTFTTPAYLDFLIVTLSGTNGIFPGGSTGTYQKFGYRLYRGDAVTNPISSLVLADGCDSLLTNGYHCALKQYRCGQLSPNTTYSIQLFIHKDCTEMLRLGIFTGGTAATVAPLPVTGIAPSHALGNLNTSPAGTSSYMIGYFGCNSRHNVSNCSPSVPSTGIRINGSNYNLSGFGTFTLASAADINIKSELQVCGPRPVIRLFKQSVTANCADLSVANLLGTVSTSANFPCLEPGDYVVQVLGIDSLINTDTVTYKTPLFNGNLCLYSNLGNRYAVTITGYTRKGINQFSISSTGMVDSINAALGTLQPLDADVPYTAAPDTFGCRPTVRPADTSCYPGNNRIMYREFTVADSGTVSFSTLLDPLAVPVLYKLYRGDAAALASAQNVFAFPDTISGLIANTECINGRTVCDNKSTCVIPGTYTFTTIGSETDIGIADQPTFTFRKTRTIHNSPFTAQDMGSIIDTIGAGGGSLDSDIDMFSCLDNAVPVNNYVPCRMLGRPATKAIYRQFYLKDPSLIRIESKNKSDCNAPFGFLTLFSGKATDGLSGLDTVGYKWTCFNDETSTDDCEIFPAGWYTVISWGTGASYDSTTRLLHADGRYNSYINYTDQFTITIIPDCRGPQFNRPYKASAQPDGQPHLFQWEPSVNSSAAYPETFKRDTLPTEYFNCTADTPFTSHPISACSQAMIKVAYYVIKTTQVSFLSIDTKGLFGKVYPGDVRTDSLWFDTLQPVQECTAVPGSIQLCNLQPGTYTLVLFGDKGLHCNKITPEVYIDSVGYSRFDFAGNAYDFDVVAPDSSYHFGKAGDVNPFDPNRPPSSDFIYCTTGAFTIDPAYSSCSTLVNGNIYSGLLNQPLYNTAYPAESGVSVRRNLWYTFVGAYPGTYRIRVENKTPGRFLQPQFAVFSSNADGSLPFNTLQGNGQVDSTINQGLQFIVKNYKLLVPTPPCSAAPDEVSFFRPACDATPTRYYIVVDNVFAGAAEPGGLLPNSQIDVSILIDSLDQKLTIADHYYQAQTITTAGAGRYNGPKDNYSCASRDITDPLYSGPSTCNKTLWYTFNPNITGTLRYRIHVDSTLLTDSGSVKLFRQVVPGDSTFTGLQLQSTEFTDIASGKWQEVCITPGTYYFLLPGCGRTTEFVYPEIELLETDGDFCSKAVPVTVSTAGSYTGTVKVTCHTIGTDYGEFGPTLTCPQGAATPAYKTSWFRMDITGTDTLDITTTLSENTNAASADIKYRLMSGDCGAMQEQSCVQDALTQNTYQCLIPGQSYYIQVFTPVSSNGQPVKGSVNLITSAVAHHDTCAPVNNCLAAANFTSSFNCTVSDRVQFANYSTFGTSIQYAWNFGYNGQTSSAVSPSFSYPALSHDSTYNVTLIVNNTGCGRQDTIVKPVTIPARPSANLGNDIIQCNNSTATVLHAPLYPGAVYQWQDGSMADSFVVTSAGNNAYHVMIQYNGCASSDTVNVFINPITPKPLQKIYLCNAGSVISGARGIGETYLWNTGAVSPSVTVSSAGYYWVDITYNNCTTRDSFEVESVSNGAISLGSDTTICFSKTNYILHAFANNATGYQWQNGSIADSFLVTSAGQYHIAISFGACVIRDTINIADYPAPAVHTIDTSVCSGSSLLLPWGLQVTSAGSYRDTLYAAGGCDSVINIINVSVKTKPNLGADSSVSTCSGNTINLNNIYNTAGNTNAWSSGNTPVTDVSAISTAGVYQLVTTTGAGCTDTAIITLSVIPKPVVTINNPSTICVTDKADLTTTGITNGSSAGLAFTYWQDAAASVVLNSPAAVTGGTYFIKGTNNNGCFDIKAVTVTNFSIPTVHAGTDISVCNNDSTILSAVVTNASSPVTWSWQPISNGDIRNPLASSTIVVPANTQLYIVTVTDSCAVTASDSIVVTVLPPVKAFAGNDTIAATGVPHQLMASGGSSYLWQPANLLNNAFIANPLATIVADSVLFTVTVTDLDGCKGYDTVKVKTLNGITYYVPNAFSPNGDNLNDIFKPVPVGIVSTDYFRIYNRYGQLIFETSQNMKGWDGTYKGKPQLTGNYIWMLKGKGINGKPVQMKGNVMLVR